MDAESLDDIAILEGTDKSSIEHDYVRHYEQAFQKFRNEPIQVLEIGVGQGGSLRMWEKFFSQARIIGVDLNRACEKFAGGRKHVEIGSQEDPEFIHELAKMYCPTIIIDDGSHKADDIKFAMERLFPVLRPGGCYVIEDLHFHHNLEDPKRPGGALEFVLDLAFMTTMGNLEHARRREMTGYFFKTIDRIEFIRRAAFIWKKAQDQNDALAITAMKELVERSGSAQNWFHFASYCLSRGGSPQEVALAARKAISLNGKWGLPHWRLSQALIQLDDLSGVLAAAEQAVALDPKLSAQLKPRIDDLRRRLRVSNSQS